MAAMLGLAALFAAARVEAQIPPATKTKPAAGKAAAPLQTPARPPGLDQVVATVNGEKVTKGDLINLLSRYQLPPDSEEQIYHDAVESIINTRLIGQYLTRLKINVSEARIDAEVATL
jgi:peptidyl-prolyl cis-trans isomerase C